MQVSLVLRAIDEASEIVRRVSQETSGALEEVRRASENITQAYSLSWQETKNLITGFSGLVTSCFALYSAIDKVSDAQINLLRANLLVQQATNALEDAQNRYNAAVARYGEESPQAQAALRDLQLAQERYNYAVERAHLLQSNYNDLVLQTAITFIPSLITAIDSGVKAFNTAKAAVEAVGGALSFLAANPIMLVISAIAALISVLIYLYNTNEDFRNAVNRLSETLLRFFKPILDTMTGAFTWLWNNVLVPFGQFINESFIAAWRALGAAWEWLKGVWDGFTSALLWGYNTFIKPIIDALSWFYNNVLKPVGEAFAGLFRGAGGGVSVPAAARVLPEYERFPEMQYGGIITRPTLALLGEAGPEAVIPLERFQPGVSVEINAPLVYVEGSADKRTAELAAELVREKLKTVLIEVTSRSAPTKRIVMPKVM